MARKQGNDALETYHLMADTVGGVPNLRGKDNLFQGIAVGISVVIGASIGALVAGKWWVGAIFGTLIALVVSGFISGFVLMILGWIRAARYKRNS